MKSILVSCGARLAPFDIKEVRRLLSYDEMALDKIGDRKTALFCIVSDTDPTFVRPDRAYCNAEIRYCPA
jgi:type IV secretion system protein VirD4